MNFIISDRSGLEVVVNISDNGANIQNGNNYIGDLIRSVVNRKELKHQAEIDVFPESLLIINDKGITEIKTETYEYLHEYLPKLLQVFDLEIIEQI